MADKELPLMAYHSPNADHAGDRVQSFLWEQTRQGQYYVPGKDSPHSRDERVKRTIQGVEAHFPNSSSIQRQAQGGQGGTPAKVTTNTDGHEDAHYNSMSADLNGVGQQFYAYGHQ